MLNIGFTQIPNNRRPRRKRVEYGRICLGLDMTTVDFDGLDAGLARTDSPLSAAESHGLLCGMLCSLGNFELDVWLAEVLPQPDVGSGLYAECRRQLQTSYAATVAGLNSSELDFYPLLPNDEATIEQKTVALADWCQGFVFGMGFGGDGRVKSMPDDTLALLQDLNEISRATVSENPAEDEDSYLELVEYVRVGVMLIHEELSPARPNVKSPPTVH